LGYSLNATESRDSKPLKCEYIRIVARDLNEINMTNASTYFG